MTLFEHALYKHGHNMTYIWFQSSWLSGVDIIPAIFQTEKTFSFFFISFSLQFFLSTRLKYVLVTIKAKYSLSSFSFPFLILESEYSSNQHLTRSKSIMVYNIYTTTQLLKSEFQMTIKEIKITTIVPENLSKLTLQATYFSEHHFLENLTGFLQVTTNQISRNVDLVILQKIFRKTCNTGLTSENALNCFLAFSLKLLKV